MADWDETGPADDDIVSQFPANERAARNAVKTNFEVDHHAADDADVGKHDAIQLVDQAGDPTITAGQVGVWNNAGILSMRAGAGAVRAMDAFPSDTRMLFWQAAAPTGWTRVTAAEVSDSTIRVFSTGTTGTGQSGGSWTISGVTTNNHAITIAELPAHNHGGSTANSNGGHNHGGGTGNAGAHSHRQYRENNLSNRLRDSPGSTPSDVGTFGNDSEYVTAYTNTGSWMGPTETEPSHSHSISSDGAHTHTLSISSVGSGSGHNHGVSSDGSWRPKYIACMVAKKD